MVEALATAEQQAREAKTKRKKILSDVLIQADNEMNTSCRKKEYQTKPNQDTVCCNGDGKNLKIENDRKTNKYGNSCDAHTSLTAEKYFEEFKIAIPLVNTQWTQTKYVFRRVLIVIGTYNNLYIDSVRSIIKFSFLSRILTCNIFAQINKTNRNGPNVQNFTYWRWIKFGYSDCLFGGKCFK